MYLIFNEALKYDLKSLASLVNKSYPEVRIAYKDVFQKNKGTIEELTAIFCKALNIPIENKYLQFFKEKFALASSNATVSKEDIEFTKSCKLVPKINEIEEILANKCKGKITNKQIITIFLITYSIQQLTALRIKAFIFSKPVLGASIGSFS